MGAPRLAELPPGTVLNSRYRINLRLHRGNFSNVYQARDLQHPDSARFVIVKHKFNLTTDPDLHAHWEAVFQREADLMASLNHPSIPTLLDFFSDSRGTHLVVDYVLGRNITQVLHTKGPPPRMSTVLRWAIALVDILSFLHQSAPPLIHRDVQPTSVMIDQNGRVWLVDFCLAQVYEVGEPTSLVGTEGFAALEQYKGWATPASDVYGAGALLHYLFTRQDPRLEPPFTWKERPIERFNPHVPEGLCAIVYKALEFSAEERYPDATAMGAAMRALYPDLG